MRKLSRTIAVTIVATVVAGGMYGFFGSPLVPAADARLRDHPRLEAAATALSDARDYIEHTPSDFRGHKSEALHAIHEALHEIALSAGEHDRSTSGVAPIKLDHVHHRLWEARERVKEGREYLRESHDGFYGHKEAALRWIDETVRQLDYILAD